MQKTYCIKDLQSFIYALQNDNLAHINVTDIHTQSQLLDYFIQLLDLVTSMYKGERVVSHLHPEFFVCFETETFFSQLFTSLDPSLSPKVNVVFQRSCNFIVNFIGSPETILVIQRLIETLKTHFSHVNETFENAIDAITTSFLEPTIGAFIDSHEKGIDEILSFPGPLPPLKIEDLNKGAARVRTYRNRRIGDFLKELHLTEGRCTGVPKIRNAMEINGSPPPIFQTDENHSFFLATLPIHPEATKKITNKQEGVPLENKTHQLRDETHQLKAETHQLKAETHQLKSETHQLTDEIQQNQEKLPLELKVKIDELGKRPTIEQLKFAICLLCAWNPLTAQQIAEFLNRKDKKHLVRQYLTPLVKDGLLKYVYPERGSSPNQAYKAQ